MKKYSLRIFALATLAINTARGCSLALSSSVTTFDPQVSLTPRPTQQAQVTPIQVVSIQFLQATQLTPASSGGR